MAIHCDAFDMFNHLECVGNALIVRPLWGLSINCAAVGLRHTKESTCKIVRDVVKSLDSGKAGEALYFPIASEVPNTPLATLGALAAENGGT